MITKSLSCTTCGSVMVAALNHCPWCGTSDRRREEVRAPAAARGPWCCLSGREIALLEQLAAMHGETSAVGRTIKAKLESAVVELRAAVPPGYATLGSRLLFRLDGGQPIGRVLVHWDRFFVPRLDLSLATPWGVALLGLKVGREALAYRRDGTVERLALVSVRCQPAPAEAAGRSSGAQARLEEAGCKVVPLAERLARKAGAATLSADFDIDPGPSVA